MKQLASANVKCVVSEGNKDIIKRALSAEFELDKNNKDDPQWKGNELEFNLGVYKIHVTIDVMPDFRGYLIMARGEENKGCMGLIAAFARERPIIATVGPITTAGIILFIHLTPANLTISAIITYTSPARTAPMIRPR